MYSSSISFAVGEEVQQPDRRDPVPVGAADRVHHRSAPSSTQTCRSGRGADQRPRRRCAPRTSSTRRARRAAAGANAASAAATGSPSTVAVKTRWMTKLAPSPRPISSRGPADDRARSPRRPMSKRRRGRARGRPAGGEDVGQRQLGRCSSTRRHSRGRRRRRTSKPRSVICRYGTSASVRPAGSSGMSASVATVTTSPVSTSTWSAPSRWSRAKRLHGFLGLGLGPPPSGPDTRTAASSEAAAVDGCYTRVGGPPGRRATTCSVARTW